MLGRGLVRTVLLLWLVEPTLQGGTGYNPQNVGVGQMLMPSKGYSLGAQNANVYQPNTKGQGFGPVAPQHNGNRAKAPVYKGYVAVPAALRKGNGAKPNGLYKVYGTAAAHGNENRAKPNGPYKGYSGVPAFLGNGNGAKPNGFGALPALTKGNGGYRTAPKGQVPKVNGYGVSPFTPNSQQAKPNPNGGFGAGIKMVPPLANKGSGGYVGTKTAKAGYGGYPNRGGFKGPQLGYGGWPTGYGHRPNGYGNYPNGGAKAPKPGYGVGAVNGGASNRQGAKPNGYGPVNGNEKGPKGTSLSPEAPSLPSVIGYSKRVVQLAELEPTIGVPSALLPTNGMPLILTNYKGPYPQVPVVPQGYPPKPIVQEQATLIPQNIASKHFQYIPQGQVLIPVGAPLSPQGNLANPVVQPSPEISPHKPVLLPFESEKAPKPITQVPQKITLLNPQGNIPKPVALQPADPQVKGPKLTAPVLLPVLTQTKGPKPVAPIPESPQRKDPNPVAPQLTAPQAEVRPLALELTPAPPQMKGPNPDCGLGASEQWTKLPSPGVAGQLPYNRAPIIPARMDGTSPVDPQMAELGREVKSGTVYGGPYGVQPMGLGSEANHQLRYGVGGFVFGGLPMGYNSKAYGKYGKLYAAQSYGSKAAVNFNSLGFNTNPKSAKYMMGGGSVYTPTAGDSKPSGKYGSYGAQTLGLAAGNSGKYDNPSLSFEALGPVTDGRSIDQPAQQYEPSILDGVKSVDQFGDGEVQPEPFAPLVEGVGEGPASYIKGGGQAEGNSAHSPLDTPIEVATPQHVPVQQNLKGPQMSQAMSWTGSKELKQNLKGFFSNGYQG